MKHREHASEIEDASTVWAAKAERGLTAEDRAELDQWLEGDSRRLGAFVRAQAAWVHAERAAALGTMSVPQEASAAEGLSPDEPQRRTLNRRMVLGGGGGALAASLVTAYVMFGFDRSRMLESGIGEIRRINLEGGATLTLDTDTRVDVVRSSNDRKLELVRGKLFLDVTRWQELPLIVQAGDLVLETVEGAFSLESLVKAPVVALVTKGTLIVSQSQGLFTQRRSVTVGKDHALTLPSNERLLASQVRPIASAQQEQLLAWRDGMLSFGGETLATAVRAFDRYSPARIHIVDSEIARQKVTGLFKADDPSGFATAVAASFGGVVSRDGKIIRISAKKSSSA